jgi:copper chaperone NosL
VDQVRAEGSVVEVSKMVCIQETGGIMKRAVSLALVFLWLASWSLAEAKDPVKPTEQDKCPVCGMFVAKYPDFIAQVIFKDGSYAVFDGVKDMFKYYFDMKKYDPAKQVSDIESIYVSDYYDLTMTDGYKAFYILGSDVFGPMGKELIPFEAEEDAKEFMIDHIGKSLLKFKEINANTLKGLD